MCSSLTGNAYQLTAAEKLMQTLHSRGVKYIFGIPGGPWMPYSDNETREALNRAFADDGPVVIEAVIDGTEYEELIARRYK